MPKVIDVKSFDELEKSVQKKFIQAGVNTVNIVAAVAKKNAAKEMESKFTLRSNFTQKGIAFTQCRRSVSSLSDIKSVVGIDEKRGYMARQETGGEKKSPSGANLMIPNTKARKGGNATRVAPKYYYPAIKANFQKRSSKSKTALAVAAFNAAKSKGFIRINNTIFHVTRFEPKRDNRMFIAKPVLNLAHKSTYTPQKEWLYPASIYAARMMQDIFNTQMDKLSD